MDINNELEKFNRAKYGDKQNDVIAQAYNQSKKAGDIYCGYNVKKYIARYIGESHKSENVTDLQKALDYLQRMIEKSTPQKVDDNVQYF